MKRQDYIVSVLLHLALFAVIVIASSVSGKAHQFNPDEITTVQIFDDVPAGQGKQQQAEPVVEEPPETKLPDIPEDYFQDDFVEEEPIQLASIETPADIAIKEMKEKPKPKPKPREQKPREKPSEDTEAKTIIGDGEVTTSIEAGEGSGGLGGIDFPYDIARAAQMIRRNWDNPVVSQKSLSCVVYFQVDRQGLISGVAVEIPSPDPTYDTYAKMAVEKTKQLPPLPISYEHPDLGFHLEFEYIP